MLIELDATQPTDIRLALRSSVLSDTLLWEVVAHLDLGVILITKNCVVIRANGAAYALLNTPALLTLTNEGRLGSSNTRVTTRLEEMVATVCGDVPALGSGICTAMFSNPDEGRDRLEIVVAPLRGQDSGWSQPDYLAILFVKDPDHVSIPIARLQRLFGLTVTEARVAKMIAAGSTVEEVAQATTTATSSVRTHVRRLLAKAGARSLADLARRLAGLVPLR